MELMGFSVYIYTLVRLPSILLKIFVIVLFKDLFWNSILTVTVALQCRTDFVYSKKAAQGQL